MKIYTEYEPFVITFAREEIKTRGGLRKAAKELNVDPGYLSRIANGESGIKPETFNRIFKMDIKVITKTYITEVKEA